MCLRVARISTEKWGSATVHGQDVKPKPSGPESDTQSLDKQASAEVGRSKTSVIKSVSLPAGTSINAKEGLFGRRKKRRLLNRGKRARLSHCNEIKIFISGDNVLMTRGVALDILENCLLVGLYIIYIQTVHQGRH